MSEMPSADKDAGLIDRGHRVGDPCEAVVAQFVYGPQTCMNTSVAVVTDAEWGTSHVACPEHAGWCIECGDHRGWRVEADWNTGDAVQVQCRACTEHTCPLPPAVGDDA